MGNYYNLNLKLTLKKDTPINIKKELVKYILTENYFVYQNSEKNIEFDNSTDFYKIIKEKTPTIEIFIGENEGNLYEYIFYKKNDYKKMVDSVLTDNFPKYSLETYLNYLDKEFIVVFKICAKKYSNEAEIFINWLKPYLIKNHDNYLGKIYDEDGYKDLNKYFYKDYNLLKEKLNNCSYICDRCDLKNDYKLCDNFKYCKRAYDLGIQNK